jgi:hypothetical protein
VAFFTKYNITRSYTVEGNYFGTLNEKTFKKKLNCEATRNDANFNFNTLRTVKKDRIYTKHDMVRLGTNLSFGILDCFLEENVLRGNKST